jgi:hypothetical protein
MATFTERVYCECCGMRLRASPADGESEERVRAKKKLTVLEKPILDCYNLREHFQKVVLFGIIDLSMETDIY